MPLLRSVFEQANIELAATLLEAQMAYPAKQPASTSKRPLLALDTVPRSCPGLMNGGHVSKSCLVLHVHSDFGFVIAEGTLERSEVREKFLRSNFCAKQYDVAYRRRKGDSSFKYTGNTMTSLDSLCNW